MRSRLQAAWLIPLLPLPCSAYDLTGRLEPPGIAAISLQGATNPFAVSTVSTADGRFQFRKLKAGTYILDISTAARGELRQTIELSTGTTDAKGQLDVLVRLDGDRLEAEPRSTGATVPASLLSIPDRAVKEYRQAQEQLSRNQPDRAAERLGKAVALAPRFSAAWNELGTLAYQAKRYNEAESDFRRALDASPDDFEPLVNLGGVLLNLGRPQEAAEYNQRAVERRPNDALANSQLGLSWLRLNDLEKAERYLKTAVQLDPALFSHPQLALAQIYVRRNDPASAIAALRGFLEQHPDDPQAAAVRTGIARLSATGPQR